jgi:hypothetical protein
MFNLLSRELITFIISNLSGADIIKFTKAFSKSSIDLTLIKDLDLKSFTSNDSDICTIVEFLPQLPYIQSLNLCNNYFGRQIVIISSTLKKMHQLTSLNLSNINIFRKFKVNILDTLFDSLPKTLTSLDFSGNLIGGNGILRFAAFSWSCLKYLNLSRNVIGNIALEAFVDKKVFPQLTNLDLSINGISSPGVEYLKKIVESSNLQLLNLEGNNLCAVDMYNLMPTIKRSTVTNINLQNNFIPDLVLKKV